MSSVRASRPSEADPSFRGFVGVGRRDMTPEAGVYNRNWGSSTHEESDKIHKPLLATALAIRGASQSRPLILATIDYCWFQSHLLLESIRKPIVKRLGLEDHEFLLVLTHSHSVPHIDPELESKPGGDKIPAFRAKLIAALEGAIDDALQSQRPAILSWGRGVATLARTRDFLDAETGRILCGPNPDGVADNTVMVGRVTDEANGKVLATLVNYACHPVSLGGSNRSVSPDYIGSMRELVQAHTGGAPCMFLHGPSGNQTPRDSYSGDLAVADTNGEVLGFAALSILRAMLPPGKRLEFARLERSGTDLAVWETKDYEVDRTTASAVQYFQLPSKDWPSQESLDAQLRTETDLANITRITRLKQFIANLHSGLGGGFPVWAMRLGQSVFIGTPAEPFTHLQTELRRRFPQLAIVVTNDTNGSFNYLPPASYYGNGAYEQDCSDFGPGCLEKVIDGAAGMIETMTR